MAADPHEVPDAEAQWAAWNARCAVSHEGAFVPARNAHVAFCRPTKPTPALRVALVSSGGVYLRHQPPFDMISRVGDHSARWIPGNADSADLLFAHDHYDHTDPDRDPNCMFSLDRLRELAYDGTIGSVGTWHVGFMGFIPDPSRFVSETIPAIVARLRADHVDGAVLSPG